MTDRLLVFGDAMAEVGVRLKSIPSSGSDVSATDPILTLGGSAANTAVAAAAAGAQASMIANVGTDSFADLIVNGLQDVDTSLVNRVPGPSPLVMILVEPGGEKAMISARGPAALPTPLPSPLDGFAHLHLSGYSFQDPGSAATAHALRSHALENGWTISLTGSAQFEDRSVLEGLDYLFVNRREAAAMSGSEDPAEAARRLRDLGATSVVVTLGSDGCHVSDPNAETRLPAVEVAQVVDATGAGDALAGGTLAALISGRDLIGAVQVGLESAASALAHRGGH